MGTTENIQTVPLYRYKVPRIVLAGYLCILTMFCLSGENLFKKQAH